MGLWRDDGKKMETTIMGLYRLGLRANGKEQGKYHIVIGFCWGYVGIMQNKMETMQAFTGTLDEGRVKSASCAASCFVTHTA